MANSLRAKRTGTTHNVGSDALLTLRCFNRIVGLELPFRVISRLKGILFRIVDASNDPVMYDPDVIVVAVHPSNLRNKTKIIHKIFPIFGVICVELTFGKMPLRLDHYETTRADVVLASSARIQITIADTHGWPPPHAEVRAFNLNNEATSVVGSPTPTEELIVNHTMLAEVLTGVGAILNPAMT
ncbi:hypothetical protein C2845_PM05G33100 [Panicum miliaceum]|uniref:Uncharacterized protein n=1 Tax=Panicum miliaceum TaxID=4540 RepID=A0A3L6SVL2_PANMI|nr:hypothetical protein C2845_PM05G33100 [Panicum miliaceum]